MAFFSPIFYLCLRPVEGKPVIRLAALTGLLLVFSSSWGLSSSDDLGQLREKMASLRDQIAQEELQKKNLSLKESQLTKKMSLLKKQAKSNPNLLLNLRIENSLKELRENLMTQQENENRRSFLQEQIIKTKEELDSQMEIEINRLIQSAKESFKKGNEKEADQSYQEALLLMEEHKQLQTSVIVSSALLPSLAEFELDGRESPEKLRELADFAIHDLENLNKEIKVLSENKSRIEEEITLRRNLVKYPGLLERGDNPSPLRVESIEKDLIQFEKNRKMIENNLIKAKEVGKALSRKVREMERMIRQQEP